MKFTRLHTAAVTGLAAVALTAGSLAVTTKAEAIEPVTTAIIGGVIAGAVVGGAAHHHHRDRAVVVETRPHALRDCRIVVQKVIDPYDGDIDYREVKVC
jgi:hypothetical protein